MKITAGKLYGATLTVVRINGERRPMPLKAAYGLARMQDVLTPGYRLVESKRNELIASYGATDESGTPIVPTEKVADFMAKWAKVAGEELEVDVRPIPLSAFGEADPPPLFAAELVDLGDLVVEG